MATIEIKGVDALVRKLGRAASIETLKPPMRRGVMRLQRDMAKYPPAIPGSKYKRGYGYPGRATSEKLGQKWTTKVTADAGGLVGVVGNNVSYGPFVQSDRFQARVHRGRWQTDRSVTEKAAPDILDDFRQAIDRALAGG